MKAVLFCLPTLLAAPFIAVIALVAGLVGLVLAAVLIAAGAVAALSFFATAFNLLGYLVTHNPKALSATFKTGLWFVVSFSIPCMFSGMVSALLRRVRAPKPALSLARPDEALRIEPVREAVRDARF